MQAVADSAQDAVQTIDTLNELHRESERKMDAYSGRTKELMIRMLDYLERNPLIEIKKTAEDMGVAFNTVARAVERLMEQGVLVQSEKSGRSRTFAYEAYLGVLRRGA